MKKYIACLLILLLSALPAFSCEADELSADNSAASEVSVLPAQARYQFEHRILPQYFYERPDAVLNSIRETGVYLLWESLCTENGIDPTYPAADYVEHWYSSDDGTTIAQIELPQPDADTLCYRIYFVYNAESGITDYYTVEYDGLLGDSAFLCGWSAAHEHMNYGGIELLDKAGDDYADMLYAEAVQIAEMAGASPELVSADTVSAPDEEPDDSTLTLISCPEQGFTVKADSAYSWDYQEGTGITIYTEHTNSIPYVIVWCDEDLIAEPLDYIREQFTPHMQEQYGEDLAAYVEYEVYDIGGRQLPAGLYTYRLQGYLIDMLRIYDSTGARTVAYTAKYVKDQGDDTLAALDTAIRSFEFSASAESSESSEPAFSTFDYYPGQTGNGEYLVYTFPDIRIYIPIEWKGLFTMEQEADGVSFYQTSSFEKYSAEGIKNGGFLFKLCAAESVPELPAMQYIGFSENVGLHFYLELPSDYPAYPEDSIRQEYDWMAGQIDLIVEESRIARSLGFYPGESTDPGMS